MEAVMEALMVVGGVGAVVGVFTFITNKRIDDLKDLFRSELKPINEKLDNHITDTNKKLDRLDQKITAIEQSFLEKQQNDHEMFTQVLELLAKDRKP